MMMRKRLINIVNRNRIFDEMGSRMDEYYTRTMGCISTLRTKKRNQQGLI